MPGPPPPSTKYCRMFLLCNALAMSSAPTKQNTKYSGLDWDVPSDSQHLDHGVGLFVQGFV